MSQHKVMVKKTPIKTRPPNLGYLGQTSQHKVVQLKAYLSNNTWLLKVKKADAEWLGLKPFDIFEITFHRRAEVKSNE